MMISYFYTNYQIKHRKGENNENEKDGLFKRENLF